MTALNPIQRVLYSRVFDNAEEMAAINAACEDVGAKLDVLGPGKHIDTEEMPYLMNNFDLVVGMGRTALEAMACGRPVVIAGRKGIDGYATPETMLEFRKSNCSGRAKKIPVTPEAMIEEFRKYDPKDGERLREYVKENNAVEKIAEQYLAL